MKGGSISLGGIKQNTNSWYNEQAYKFYLENKHQLKNIQVETDGLMYHVRDQKIDYTLFCPKTIEDEELLKGRIVRNDPRLTLVVDGDIMIELFKGNLAISAMLIADYCYFASLREEFFDFSCYIENLNETAIPVVKDGSESFLVLRSHVEGVGGDIGYMRSVALVVDQLTDSAYQELRKKIGDLIIKMRSVEKKKTS